MLSAGNIKSKVVNGKKSFDKKVFFYSRMVVFYLSGNNCYFVQIYYPGIIFSVKNSEITDFAAAL